MDKHYICHGGCKGVANAPGTCQAPDCANFQQPLEQCNCGDGKHAQKE